MDLCACQLGFRLALQSSEIIWRALVFHTKVSDVRIMYGVWYWRDSHVVLIARLRHVPQLPGEGDAKGIRLPFQNRQSRANSRGCMRAPEDTPSLSES